jgi:hypothetical protein
LCAKIEIAPSCEFVFIKNLDRIITPGLGWHFLAWLAIHSQ